MPTLLSLRLANSLASLGSIVPGLGRDYDAALAATVTSTAGNATLSAAT